MLIIGFFNGLAVVVTLLVGLPALYLLAGATERIIEYLADEYSVPLNAVRLNYYEDEGREYIGRSWLIDPAETPEQPGKRESWNGRDYYVSFGQGTHRRWTDAKRYGFIGWSRRVV